MTYDRELKAIFSSSKYFREIFVYWDTQTSEIPPCIPVGLREHVINMTHRVAHPSDHYPRKHIQKKYVYVEGHKPVGSLLFAMPKKVKLEGMQICSKKSSRFQVTSCNIHIDVLGPMDDAISRSSNLWYQRYQTWYLWEFISTSILFNIFQCFFR